LPIYSPLHASIMATSGLDLARIPILMNQSNYRDWALDVSATARLGGYWKAFLSTNTTSSTDAAELDRIEQREEKAMGLILKTSSNNLRIELSDYAPTPAMGAGPVAHTAQLYWDYLKAKFEKQDGVSALLNFSSLVKTELVDNGNLEAQLNTLESMRSKCALNAIKLENWQYAALLLIHLPESYRHISDSFLTTGKIDQLDTAAVTAKIIKTEIRCKAE